MGVGNNMESFFSKHEQLQEKVLKELTSLDNIEMKTEITEPINLAFIRLIERLCKNNGFNKTSQTLSKFCELYLQYMVSFKRQGRKEFVEAFRSLQDRLGGERGNLPLLR